MSTTTRRRRRVRRRALHPRPTSSSTSRAPDEALVRMVAAGLCHTDLGVAERRPALPAARGPRARGRRASSRPSARPSPASQPGDHVVLSFTSCGGCTQLPRRPPGVLRHLAAAEPARRPPRRRHRHDQPRRRAARRPLLRPVLLRRAGVGRRAQPRQGRPGRTAGDRSPRWAAACRPASAPCGTCWSPGPGDTLVVLGAGAVGLSAVMAAALTPATTVIAVDRVGRTAGAGPGAGRHPHRERR